MTPENLSLTAKSVPKSRHAANRHTGCWNETGQAQALRVELNDGSFFVFPYVHWMFAKLERSADHESLTVSFATHDLQISGRRLRDLGIALQKFAVDWIKENPERYTDFASKDAAWIERIEIVEHPNEVQSSEEASRASDENS